MAGTGLIERLGEIRTRALGALKTMARKEAETGKTEAPEKLLATLTTAGLSPEKYDEMLGLHRRYEELRRAAAPLDSAGKHLSELRAKLKSHREETRALLEPRKAEEARLASETRAAAAKLYEARSARRQIEELESVHAAALGVAVPNLDAASLTSGGTREIESRSILPGPQGGPTIHVAGEVFQNEARRRHRAVVAAMARAQRQHLVEYEAWAARQPRGLLGRVIPKEKPPAEPGPILWADLVTGRVPPVTEADLAHEDVRSALREPAQGRTT